MNDITAQVQSTSDLKVGDRIRIVEGRISVDTHVIEVKGIDSQNVHALVVESTNKAWVGTKYMTIPHGTKDALRQYAESQGASVREIQIFREVESSAPSKEPVTRLEAKIPGTFSKKHIEQASEVRPGDYAILYWTPKSDWYGLVQVTGVSSGLIQYKILATSTASSIVGQLSSAPLNDAYLRKVMNSSVYRSALLEPDSKGALSLGFVAPVAAAFAVGFALYWMIDSYWNGD